MKLILSSCIVLLFVGCTSTDTKGDLTDEQLLAYFYTFHQEPVVYVYQDSLNPMYEIFERIFTTEDELLGKHLWIERYNTNFILTETIELVQSKNYNVYNHLVGIRGDLVNSTVKDSTFFPLNTTSHFSSTFPSYIDTIAFHYEIKRTVLPENGLIEWEGKKVETLTTIDSVTTYAIDTKNQKEQKNTAVSNTIYAKGIGKIQVKSQNGKVNLKLSKILPDSEWKFIITKE